MIVQCATFPKSLNLRNIDKSVSDIQIRIRFPFQSSFWISLSGCKLTILPDIQRANRIVIISAISKAHSKQAISVLYNLLFKAKHVRNMSKATGTVAYLLCCLSNQTSGKINTVLFTFHFE